MERKRLTAVVFYCRKAGYTNCGHTECMCGEHVFKMVEAACQSAFRCCDVTEDNGLKQRNFLPVHDFRGNKAWQVGSMTCQRVASPVEKKLLTSLPPTWPHLQNDHPHNSVTLPYHQQLGTFDTWPLKLFYTQIITEG